MRVPRPAPGSLLVIQPGALGDTLLSLPAIRALRAGSPSDDLVLVTQREAGELLRDCGEIDAVVPIEGPGLTELLAGQAPASQVLRQTLLRCTLAVGWMNDPDGGLQAALGRAGCRRRRVRALATGAFQAVHQADRYLETVAGLVPVAVAPRALRVPPPVVEGGRRRLHQAGWSGREPLVVLHAGSGSPHKCADPGLFASAMRAWHSRGVSTVLLAGPADAEHLAAVTKGCTVPPMIVRGCDLRTVAGVLQHAALYVGYDSGITHLAAALGLAVIGLYGPTDPTRWAPREVNVRILRGAPCECPDWEAVQSCIEKPCLRIPAEALLEACEKQLAKRGAVTPGELQRSCEAL